jgi:hypothetical protein
MTQRAKITGEVFTPRSLIREMLNALPNSVWFDPNKRWLEPSAGDGNFLVEIKARLLQAGHNEKHILENMLFSVELIDDNHWVLQHRLGYLVDGQPNPKFWPNGENFDIGKIHKLAQDLNDYNPYHEHLGLDKDEVVFHRNHVCTTALEYDMSFGRTDNETVQVLKVLEERDLGDWPETDTPDIGEKYVVERVLNRETAPSPAKNKPTNVKSVKHPKSSGGGWQIRADWYGKGMTIRCKKPFDGSFWECDHDALADVVNASLKAKGKTILGEPGSAQKQFGSSSGLREPDLWRRV